MKDSYSTYCKTCEVIIDEGSIYCEECKKTISIVSPIKKKLKKQPKYNSTIKIIDLKCSKCNIETEIRTTHIEVYTSEIIKNWTCPICKMKKDGHNG